MRKIIYSFLAIISLLTTSCAQTIGIVENNNYKITCDTVKIKKAWEIILNNQKTPGELVSFEIVSGKTETSEAIYYLLLAKTKDNSLKIGRKLELKDNVFTFFPVDKASASSSATISCSGCQDGCNIALKDDGNWKCTACIEGTTCTKTETQSDPAPMINHP